MRPAARKTRNNLTKLQPARRLADVELAELLEFIEENSFSRRKAGLSAAELEVLVQAIRRELALSFWQSAALSLFVFILGVFIGLLLLLVQK